MHIRREIWLWTLFVSVAMASLALPAVATEEQPAADKVAVVNGTVLTRSDFDREMASVRRRYSKMGTPLTDAQLSAIRKRVFERFIEQELLFQESQKQGIKVDDAALNEEFKKRFPEEADLKKDLNSANLTETALKSRLRRGMAIEKLIDKESLKDATITDKEVRNYYDAHPDFFKQPEQVHASHILIEVDVKADKSQKAEAREKLEQIRQKVKKGEDFAALAKESSQCPSSSRGGDVGYFRRGQMAKPFERAAFALKPGEVSDIVETRFGYHLIKVIDKKPERTVPYEEVKNRIEQRLKKQKIGEKVRLYIEGLREKAKVETFPLKAVK